MTDERRLATASPTDTAPALTPSPETVADPSMAADGASSETPATATATILDQLTAQVATTLDHLTAQVATTLDRLTAQVAPPSDASAADGTPSDASAAANGTPSDTAAEALETTNIDDLTADGASDAHAADADAHTRETAANLRHQRGRELLNKLNEQYPQTFFSLSHGRVKPLKISIHLDLQPTIEGWGYSRADLRMAMVKYTHSRRYQLALIHENQRVDLQGEAVGEVTAEQKEIAKQKLEKYPRRQPSQTAAERPRKPRREPPPTPNAVADEPQLPTVALDELPLLPNEPSEETALPAAPPTEGSPRPALKRPQVQRGNPRHRDRESSTRDSSHRDRHASSRDSSHRDRRADADSPSVLAADAPRKRQLDAQLIAELQAKMSRKAVAPKATETAAASSPKTDDDSTHN